MEYNKKFNGEYASNNGRNIVPRAVIVIGKTPVYALDYNLVTNTNFETDSLNFTIPMDLLDIRELVQGYLKKGQIVPIAVYAGFIDSTSEHFYTYDFFYRTNNSNDLVKSKLLEKYKELLSLRWVGIMNQPELIFAEVNSPDLIKFTANDFSRILGKYKYENQYENENATVKNIVKDLNSKLSKFKIVFDSKLPQAELTKIQDYIMGTDVSFQDDEENKVEVKQYSTTGKTYLGILQDICEKTRTTIVPDIEGYDEQSGVINYKITKRVTSNTGWKLYRDRDFKSVTLRLGEFTSTPTAQIAVKMISRNSDSTEDVIGSFPTTLGEASPEGQRLFSYKVSDNLSKRTLDLLAEEKASEISKLEVNADVFIPNAIVGLQCKHQVRLENSKNYSAYRDLKIIGEVNFVVDSISEDYNQEGLSQKVEMSLDLNTNNFLSDSGQITAMDIFDVNDSTKDVKFLPPDNAKKDINSIPEYLKKFRNNGIL
jgi:hypothetical protein